MSSAVATPVLAPELFDEKAQRRRGRRDYVGIGLWVALAITALLWFLPLYLMFTTSVKSKPDLNNTAMWSLPTSWEWGNYPAAIDTGDFWTTATNSLIVAIIKVPLGLAIAAAAAYALARIRFRGGRIVLMIIAIGSMVPVQIGLGPLFGTMLDLGLLDSLYGLILPYLAFGIPYQIFVLYGFFRGIPEELEESARIDGASTFRIFWQIILPLAKPALAALFVLDFVATWNEYAMATTLLRSQSNWTIPLAVQSFSTQHGTDYGPMNAFIFMSAIPVLIVYLLFQRYFVQGALAGAVKG
ncbi:carbohydrate ABC transporter permease [Microbacterium sp. Bi128]|uniref:carbohydrate ABC transporter permease n=1 Tax=Microbacterium sp. Bi128 TaxID=2821115 RepID=UPI001D1AC1F7|nr:carbohydrate ABC transporter permease [Microbacterium sp. Bi128]CAH0140225.1 L-arabinose transport system permease protein AraQ [Microbacterium sp. Bi128]